MLINNIDISNFGASVSKKFIQPTGIKIEKERFKLNFHQISSELEFKKVYVKLLFEAETRDMVYQNISNFMAKLTDELDIKFKNLSHYFHVYLVDHDTEDTDFDEWLYLNLNFEGFEYSEQLTETINRITTKTINVLGNTETPAIVEITPSVDIIDIVLTGLADDTITVRNLTGGKKVTVNGEDGTVTVDGVNKYGDTDLWSFPRLKPGANTITVSRSNVDISVKYKPRFI